MRNEIRIARLSDKIQRFFVERDPEADEKPGDITDMFDVVVIRGTKVVLKRLADENNYLAVVESRAIARLIRREDSFLMTLRQHGRIWIAWHMSPPGGTDDLTLDDERHGANHPHYVCQHLLRLGGQGFCVPLDDIENADQAWCFHCDAVMEQEGGWTQAALGFAKFDSVCGVCFLEILERNKFYSLPSESLN